MASATPRPTEKRRQIILPAAVWRVAIAEELSRSAEVTDALAASMSGRIVEALIESAPENAPTRRSR
jgi:hypothetical protein